MTHLFEVLDATWPAHAVHEVGPWVVREGRGGGKRVSAATAGPGFTPSDIAAAEARQRDLGQALLFMVRPSEANLDAALADRGYDLVDPVQMWSAPVARMAGEVEFLGAFSIWPPLASMTEIWAEDGIGPSRIAVMERVQAPKTAILGRVSDRPAGVAFVAAHERTAMVHALSVLPDYRRRGCATNILREAANWAGQAGADTLSLVVTRGNAPANSLYASLGMEIVGKYHYRQKNSPQEA